MLGYLGSIVLLLRRGGAGGGGGTDRLAGGLAGAGAGAPGPMGQISLTCYLGSSLLLNLAYYGFGLGLYGRTGVGDLLVGLTVYALLLVCSTLYVPASATVRRSGSGAASPKGASPAAGRPGGDPPARRVPAPPGRRRGRREADAEADAGPADGPEGLLRPTRSRRTWPAPRWVARHCTAPRLPGVAPSRRSRRTRRVASCRSSLTSARPASGPAERGRT